MATGNASSDPDIHMSKDVLLGDSNSEQLSNDDVVSLINISLREALQQQNEVIMSSIVKQINSLKKYLDDLLTDNNDDAIKFCDMCCL